jgi:dienelactone hydrolase
MAHVVLFHSILGLRPIEHAIAERFEREGHRVTLPDLFDGRATDDFDAGFAIRKEVGNDAIMARATAALAASPDDAVLSGVSFGAFLIAQFWDNRPRMAGALLYAGITPWMTPPRANLPVSAHIARPDPFDDEDFFAEWVADSADTALEVHRYDGVGHYFLDPVLRGYDPAQAALCLDRSVAFLSGLYA